MSYELSLAAAGATVHEFKNFGSYQGDWWARVTLADGRSGWINGSYGSCSGCDAFEAEFGYGPEDSCNEHGYTHRSDCEACVRAKAEHQEKLARFGAGYLDGFLTDAEALAQAEKNLSWDSDAAEMVAFIKQHSAVEGGQR